MEIGKDVILTNEEKGRQGEMYVIESINNAAQKIGAQINLFNNIILKFPSMYGYRGMMTTELDHVVVLRERIVIIETKNAIYKDVTDYNARTWELENGEKTDNPIYQNRMHKEILCSLLGVKREDVYTVECLLNYANPPMKTQYPNDYVLGYSELEEKLALIFYENYFHAGYENSHIARCWRLFEFEENSNYQSKYHKKNLESAARAEVWQRTHEGKVKIKRTDVAYCPYCGGKLVIKKSKWVDHRRENERKSRQFMVGCSNYKGKGDPQRHACYFYSEKPGEGFDRIKRVSLGERMGWNEMEKHIPTLLDNCENPKEQLEKLLQQLNREHREY